MHKLKFQTKHTEEHLFQKGIYLIRCIPNGRVYIGQTRKHFYGRWLEHQWALSHGKHNEFMQKSFNKYGFSNFECEIIEVIDASENIEEFTKILNEREVYWIKHFREKLGRREVFNCNDGGDGYNPSPETRRKIGEAQKLRKGKFHHAEEWKRKASERRKKKQYVCRTGPHTSETKQKVSEGLKRYYEQHHPWNYKGIKKEKVPKELRAQRISEGHKKFHKNGGTIANVTKFYSSYSRHLRKCIRIKHFLILDEMNRYISYLESRYDIKADNEKIEEINNKHHLNEYANSINYDRRCIECIMNPIINEYGLCNAFHYKVKLLKYISKLHT